MQRKKLHARNLTKDEVRHRAAMDYTFSQLLALNNLDMLVEQKVAQLLAKQSHGAN